LRDYQILPTATLALARWALPTAELVAGIALLTPLTRAFGALLGTALLLAYALAMAANLARGRANIDCGCAVGRRRTLSWWLVLRNTVLATLSVALLLPLGIREMPWVEALLALLVAGFVGLMWVLLPMLKHNRVSLISGVKS
ncbi:MAG: MauE/DoxX family redox-associated membrane protein, partial [Parahaliea sp.]